MKQAVSIIHGSRRPFSDENYQKNWMEPLKNHLKSEGFNEVDLYYWSGKLFGGFSEKQAHLYAKHLSGFVEKCKKDNITSISIFAKSIGTVIANNAVYKLQQSECFQKLDTFIKIASPDITGIYDGQIYNRVISITSENDLLYKIAKKFWPISSFLISRKIGGTSLKVQKIKLLNIHHSDFNHNRIIHYEPLFEGYLFDFYTQLLKRPFSKELQK